MGGPDPNLCPVTPAEPPVGDGGRLAIGGRGLVGDYSTRTAVDSLGTLVTNFATGTYVLPRERGPQALQVACASVDDGAGRDAVVPKRSKP